MEEVTKVKITKVYATDKKKDGSEIVSKFGKKSWRVGLKTNEHGDEWVNGFTPFDPSDWEGQEKELVIYQEEWNGKQQWKFKLASTGGPDIKRITALEFKVGHMEHILREAGLMKEDKDAPKKVPYPEEDINPDDIPF